jgi:hypothetical protein
MADLQVEGSELVLHLSGVERVEGLHGDLRVPLTAVEGVEVLDDAHGPAGIHAGIKIGTRIPGIVEVGSIRGRQQKIFAAVHHDTPRGVRVRLQGSDFTAWVIGAEDPEAVVARLALPS